MKTYFSYVLDSTSEALMALLSLFPFESFEEKEKQTIAYIPNDVVDPQMKKDIAQTIQRFYVSYTINTIEPQNWNAIWESNFQPVVVENFCVVRADFHPPDPAIQYDILINPKMAFGTGHHETTYMMIAAMQTISFEEKSVFDYGCGTGILAILASKLGADPILAIDIEEESYENTIENSDANHVVNIKTSCGILSDTSDQSYDIILANINRGVLMESVIELYKKLKPAGTILLSGILDKDEKMVSDQYIAQGFILESSFSKGYWRCLKFKK